MKINTLNVARCVRGLAPPTVDSIRETSVFLTILVTGPCCDI